MITARQFFSCLGDDVRLASMLLVRACGELCVCELVCALDEPQSKVSRHLAQLRNCQLLKDRRQGQWVYYSLHPDLPDWALQVLDQAASAEASRLRSMSRRLTTMRHRPPREAACTQNL